MIDILNIEPTKITKGIGNLQAMIFAAPKFGKSSFCAKCPKTLIIDTERGYNCISGATVITVKNFAEVKIIVNQLKKPQAKEMYNTVAIDVVDQLGAMCEKYVMSALDITSMNELAHGRAWDVYKKELSDVLRGITMEGYGLILTSHIKQETIKPQVGEDYTVLKASPTPSLYKIVSGMCDIIGYGYTDPVSHERFLRMRCNDNSIEVGSRFKYLKEVIPFSYDSLVEEVNRAIEEEAENGSQVDKDRSITESDSLDYNELKVQGTKIVEKLFEEDPNNMNKVNAIVESVLGPGKRFSECSPNQSEAMMIIVEKLKELCNN